jgi:hypothetical protein
VESVDDLGILLELRLVPVQVFLGLLVIEIIMQAVQELFTGRI